MTLTGLSKIVRRGVVIGAFVVVFYYLWVLLLFPFAKNSIARLFPPKDPATPIYGALPALEFSQKEVKNDAPPSFKLDTKTGKLPGEFPKKMTVYKFKSPIPSFEKGEAAVLTAKEFGFTDADMVTSLKETTFKWKNSGTNAAMSINTNTKEFTVKVPIMGRGQFFPRDSFSHDAAAKQASDLLNKIKRFQDELYKQGTIRISLGKIVNTRIMQTTELRDAQLARIDYFRSIDNKKYPILGPDPRKGLINITLKRYDEKTPYYNYPVAECYEWSVETQSNATYPVIPVSDAWEILKSNKAVITNITPKGEGNFTEYVPIRIENVFISNIYLAYFDSPNLMQYLQPIWVFEGTYTTSGTKGGEITYYYPAVTSEYIQLPQPETQAN